MQTMTPTLDSIFRHEIPPEIRTSVLKALTTRPLVQGTWLDHHRGGCLMAVATMQVTGLTREQFRKRGDYTNLSARTLGIPSARVEAGYQEWDRLPEDAAKNFIAQLKAELNRTAPTPPMGTFKRAVSAVRRQFVPA
jgi:hypothetical protein